MNDITQGIVDALHHLYYGKVKIYTEVKKQGFEAPCFFVEMIDSFFDHELHNRYLEQGTYQISYFTNKTKGESPDYGDLQKQIRPISMVLTALPLRDGHTIRGQEISSIIEDDVLHVTVSFKRFIYKELEKKPTMETLNLKQETKED